MPKVLAALTTAALALAALTGIAAPGAAAAPSAIVPTCTNATCPDPTGWAAERWKAHAGYPSNGGTVDGANCTNYVAWRLIRTHGLTETAVRGLGNASTWDTQAAAKGYRVDRIATVGSVAQWDANHVAYVEQVNGDGTIVISESNVWVGTSTNRMWLRHRVVSASAVDHFIHVIPSIAPSRLLAPGDFDSDGHGDLIVVSTAGALLLYRGDGAGDFLDPAGTQLATGWANARAITPGDWDGDGHPDLLSVSPTGRMYLFSGNGADGWSRPRLLIGRGWQTMKFVVSPGDFSGDGHADVLAVRKDGTLALYTGNGRGGFKGKAVTIASGFGSARLVSAPGDVDGDGKPDLIAVGSTGVVTLYRGNGAGRLISKAGTPIGSGWADARSLVGRGDVTGDAFSDFYALRGGVVQLYPGTGSTLPATGLEPGITW